MNYTKQSLVGLFMLLIMLSARTYASDTIEESYPYGDEFIYYTCPDGFNKKGNNCEKEVFEPISLKCEDGFSLSADKQKCTKTVTQTLSYSCPSGYQMNGNSCRKTLTERYYSPAKIAPNGSRYYPNSSLVYRNSSGKQVIYWKGSKVYEGGYLSSYRHADGWVYGISRVVKSGSWYSDSEVIRKKVVDRPRLEHCSNGYTQNGSLCSKVLLEPSIHFCKKGVNVDGQCTINLSQIAQKHSPIQDVMSSLYSRYSSNPEVKDTAAFRYLERMYTLDPETGDIISAISNNEKVSSYSDLWGAVEKDKADNAIEVLEGFLSLRPDLAYLESALIDVYYDRAAADYILANRSIDESRIRWIEQSSLSDIELSRQEAVDILQRTLVEYWNLVENHTQAFITAVPKRDLQSAIYLNGEGQHSPVYEGEPLVVGYKDVVLVYQVMNKLVEQQSYLSKVKAIYADSSEQKVQLANEAQTVLELVLNKESQLSALLESHSETHFMLSSEKAKLESYSQQLKAIIQWLRGNGNYLGLPDDFVLLLQGYKPQGSVVHDSFDAIEIMLEGQYGLVTTAQQALIKAQEARANYKYQRDIFRQTFSKEQRVLNDRLFALLGCTLEKGDSRSCDSQSQSSRKGSLIVQQQVSIEAAKLAVQRAETAHQSISENISIELERIEKEKQVSNAVEKIAVLFGRNELLLSKLIKDSQTSATNMHAVINSESTKQSLETLKGFVNSSGQIDMPVLLAALEDLKSNLKNMPADQSDHYTQTLAVLERAAIRGLERGLLDINSEARIKALTLELETTKVDIAKSLVYLEQEVERLIGFSSEARRLIAQLNQNEVRQAERYYADPLHYSELTAETLRAELYFVELQEWLFYAVQALEYKWQEPFYDRTRGFDKNSVFEIQDIQQLVDYFASLKRFDDVRNFRATQEATDTVSLKKHIFGYVDTLRGKTMWYPSPDGTGEMLTADEAFKAKLQQLSRRVGTDYWFTAEFSTVKELPRTNFFQGPVVADEGDLTCLLDAGTYLDKIDAVSLNLVVSHDVSGEVSTPAYLTYGGNNYMRSRIPGALTDNEDGVKDELIAYSARFWDVSNGGFFAKDSYRQQMKANIMLSYDKNSELLNPTYSFKERSVAASGWRLSVKLSDRYGDIVDLESIDDIEMRVKHRFQSRNAETCGGGDLGPLLLLK
ncbi:MULTISPECIES: hypothetical protein [Vibrio]|uniref:hypothetical protein n=1 Tax=Vibrio TaxID=662 RepID=UPI0001B949E8|nr:MULTISPECIES: hypothetical protein [Vibrio]EEX34162.1 hypothetical protein VIC_002060 [Vibrio coralliilyticus ATCC BAA-450]